LRHRIATALILIAGLALMAAGVRFYMQRDAENRLLPGEDVVISDLRDPLPGNASLACPTGYCRASAAIISPVFAVPVTRLYEAWRQVIAEEPRVTVLAADGNTHRVVALQRSALFQFPDIVIAEFVPLAPDRSSLAVYSRARYGQSDFGVNRGRIDRWLRQLETFVPNASSGQ